MCFWFFKKKKPVDRVKADRDLVETNAKTVEALVILAQGNAEVEAQLRELQEKLKYLIPTEDPKVYDCDKGIRNKLGDLRIALTKADGESSKKVQECITEIKLAMADRNVKV